MGRTTLGVMLIAACTLLAACSSPTPLPTEPDSTPIYLTATLQPVSTQTPNLSQLRATQTQTAWMERTQAALTVNAIEQTRQVRRTAAALTPSPTRRIPTPMATIDYALDLDAWSVYTNEQYAFSFNYHTVWDIPPFNSCGIQEYSGPFSPSPDVFRLYFGARGKFSVIPANGLSRTAFIDQWIQDWTEPGIWELGGRENLFINGIGATRISISGGRYSESTFFYANDYIYTFSFTGGAFCEFREVGLDEFDLYINALNTFSFITPIP